MTPNHTQNSVPVDPNRKKLVWKEAATGGLYLGLALVAVMVISYLGRMDATLSWVPGLLNFAALCSSSFSTRAKSPTITLRRDFTIRKAWRSSSR